MPRRKCPKKTIDKVTLIILGAAQLVGTSCGRENETKKQDPVVANVRMTHASPQLTLHDDLYRENSKCYLDNDSGLVDVQYVDGQKSFRLRVRDYVNSAQRYNCRQASNNNLESSNTGDLYESCMVEVSTQSADSASFDTYAMHRANTSIKRFDYFDDCFVDLSRENQRLVGDFQCMSMAQVILEGRRRNPVSNDSSIAIQSADFAGKFACDLIFSNNNEGE